MKWLFGCCLLTQPLPEDAIDCFSGTTPQTSPLFHLQAQELGPSLKHQPSGARLPSSASPKPPLCVLGWRTGSPNCHTLVSPRTQQVPGWGSYGIFSSPFCCTTPAVNDSNLLLASLLSLQPLCESQASLWVSLRACKFLGPIRTKNKKSIFLSYPLSWPLGTNPKPTAIPPFQPARYQHPCACQGKAALQAHFGISNLPRATPLSPERRCFVCKQHMRCSGGFVIPFPGVQ